MSANMGGSGDPCMPNAIFIGGKKLGHLWEKNSICIHEQKWDKYKACFWTIAVVENLNSY